MPRAAAEELLEVGARRLRSAAIAERAGITESTLFRNYGNLENVLAAAERWSWDEVHRAISEASFTQASSNAREALLRDTSAIWTMRDREETATAATAAFYFLRRRGEFGLPAPCSAQRSFEARLGDLCEKVVAQRGTPDIAAARLLATLIENYISVTWLTWLMMPVGSDDLTESHDLTHDEAQIGVIMLLDRYYADGNDALLTNLRLSN